MKAQDSKNNSNMQGDTTSDRAFMDQRENQKQKGISNGGGQRSFQTSSRDSMHHPQKKKS
jgi:hypothetical protein